MQQMNNLRLVSGLRLLFAETRMLKILRKSNGEVIYRLCGTMGAEEIPIVEQCLEEEVLDRRVALDLTDLRLVSREAVQFLERCERCGIDLVGAAPYIRRWIQRERKLKKRRRSLRPLATAEV